MSTSTENEWFKTPSLPMTAVAHVLIEMDQRGNLDEAMKDALRKHADGMAHDVVWQIQAIGNAAASAISGNNGLSDEDAAATFWGIASLAEQLHAAQELQIHFREHSKPAGKPKTQ